MADKKKQEGFFSKVKSFFSVKEIRSEMKKVVWPTKQQIVNNTTVVICVAVVLGAFVFGIDFVMTAIREFAFQNI